MKSNIVKYKVEYLGLNTQVKKFKLGNDWQGCTTREKDLGL